MLRSAGAVWGPSDRGAGKGWLKGGLALAWVLAASPCWAQSVAPAEAVKPVEAAPVAATAPGGMVKPDETVKPAEPATPASTITPPVQAETAPAANAEPAGRKGVEEETGIVVSSRPLAPDPAKAINKISFDATMAVDGAVIEPFSKGYEAVIPSPARDGIHNALYNLREPVIAVNFLLQHKIGKTGETLARFVINSTLGIAGLFDMAKRKPFRLPFRDNGFSDTMGFYGVPNGPYIFIPLLGSTTLRDLTGRMVDRAALPFAFGGRILPTAAVVPMIVLGILDRRLVNAERIREERESEDPYSTTRDNYLRRRADEIEGLRHPHGQEKPEKEEG